MNRLRTVGWTRVAAMAQATGLFAIARVCSQAGSFVATLLVARFLGPSQFGQYALLLAAAAIVVNGLGMGLPVLALRESALGHLSIQLKRRMTLATLGATGIGTILIAGFGALVLGPRSGIGAGALAGAYFAMVCTVTLGSAFHAGLGRFKRAAIGEALMGLFLPVTTLVALKAGWGILGSLGALVLGAIPAVLWLYLTLPYLPRSTDGSESHLFTRSLSFVAMGLASGGYARVDTVLLRLVSDPATVGIYAAAYRLMGPLQVVLSAFGTVFFSRISSARGRGTDWRELHRKGRRLMVLTLSPMVVIGILLAPTMIRVIYGSGFSTAVLPAQILLLSMLPVAWSWPSGYTMNAFDRQAVWVLILASGIALDALLVLVLGRPFGAVGAAVAWLSVETLTIGLVTLAMRRLSFGYDRLGESSTMEPDTGV